MARLMDGRLPDHFGVPPSTVAYTVELNREVPTTGNSLPQCDLRENH
jgi:hypothetical protein